jgi:hypothetical protein
MSGAPPGAVATMMRTGRVGKASSNILNTLRCQRRTYSRLSNKSFSRKCQSYESAMIDGARER